MKTLLILFICVLGIYLYEAYWPIKDKDQEQFDQYVENANLYQEKLGIPIEISIFFKLNTAKKAKKLVTKYRKCQFKSSDIWIKNISPKLNWGEIRQIKKFKIYATYK